MSELPRRTVVKGLAWTTPVVAVAVTSPAFAASADPITGLVEASKCPGKSTKDEPDTVILTFKSNMPLPNFKAADVVLITVNGVAIPVERVVVEGNLIHVVTIPRANSADATGTLVIKYKVGSQTYQGEFAYSGTHPNHELCGRI